MEIEKPDKKYRTAHHIVYSCQYPIIFCPKYRRKVLTGEIETRLQELILAKQADYGYLVQEMDVMPDHVHLLLDVDPRIGIHKIVGQIKGYTAHMIRKEYPYMKKRLPSLWTRSKFISSVGAVTLEVVKRYIEDQKNV